MATTFGLSSIFNFKMSTSSAQMNVSVEVSERIKAQSQDVRGQIERVVLGKRKLSEGSTECLRSGFSFLSLIEYVKTHILHQVVRACEAASVMSNCDPMDCSPLTSSCLWDSQARILGVGCHVLLQGNFQTQGGTCAFCSSCMYVDSLLLSHREGHPIQSGSSLLLSMLSLIMYSIIEHCL